MKHKFIISGGGTGGHIFPAVAIANKLKEREPDCEILFVGAEGRMEMERVPQAGYKIVGLPIMGIQRKLTLKNLKVPFMLIKSMVKAKKVIKEFKPDVAIGVGGYASGPLLKKAESLAVPSVLQEQNSYPGITNKLLAKKAAKICVAYDNMDQFFPADKIIKTGNPVRSNILNAPNLKTEGRRHFNLRDDKPVVLVIGGSLGARTINNAVTKILRNADQVEFQLIWQTGKLYYENIKSMVDKMNLPHVQAMPFISEMELAYGAADVVISRAGALSISELCAIGMPSILIPSPNVSEDHQTKNAMALVDKKAALLVKDVEAEHKLKGTLDKLLNDPLLRKDLGKNAGMMGMPNAADLIADEILKLVER